jgi:hypothetical protein
LKERLDLLDAYAVTFKSYIVAKELKRPKPHIEVPEVHVPWKTLGMVAGAVCAGVLTLGVASLGLMAMALDPVICGVLDSDPEEPVLAIFQWLE